MAIEFDNPPEETRIGEYLFVLTCSACPEQYEVFRGDRQVAYLRLRGGAFTVEAPDVGGDLLLLHEFDDDLKGQFDDQDERMKFLGAAAEAIARHG